MSPQAQISTQIHIPSNRRKMQGAAAHSHVIRLLSALFFLPVLYSGLTAAQSAEDFYSGRTVTILVGSGAGGVTDTTARLIGAQLEEHIPGGPTVIVQNMPGGGSVTMTNHLYRAASKDGSVLGYSLPAIITAQLMEPRRAKYDGREFNWIGSAITATNTLSVMSAAPVTDIETARESELVIGASGRGSLLYQFPALTKELLGLNLRIITGYQGSSEITLAMERGEVNGQGAGMDYWAIARPDWLVNGQLIHLTHIGPPDPVRAPGTPHLRDLVESDSDKALVTFLEIGSNLGWPLFAPPGVPPERVEALRLAFDSLLLDQEFIDIFYNAMRTPVRPISGIELAARVNEALATPESVIETAKDVLGL
jgi:tripartite-type tricarboxylate transporter receptor subunit TctC